MTDTPRTGNGEWCHADFARELERELAQRTAEVAKAEAERDEARRQACRDDLHVRMGIYTAKEFAIKRGWDCFKEGTEQC